MADDRIDADYLPNPAGAVHGPLWSEATLDLDNYKGLAKNDKAHPVFGMIPDCTEYGGSDC